MPNTLFSIDFGFNSILKVFDSPTVPKSQKIGFQILKLNLLSNFKGREERDLNLAGR